MHCYANCYVLSCRYNVRLFSSHCMCRAKTVANIFILTCYIMQYAFCMQRRAIMYCGKSAVVTSVCRGHVSNSQTIKKDQSLTCNGLVFLGQK